MNRSRTIILPLVLLALLGALAFLQYRWLVQISQSEKDQTQKRLQNDTEHFAEDFNKVIQSAYFSFQIPAGENWQTNFSELYQNWLAHTDYPDAIKGFTYVSAENYKLRYDQNLHQFVQNEAGADFASIKSDFVPVDEKNLILRMPIYKAPEKIDRVNIVTDNPVRPAAAANTNKSQEFAITRRMKMPEAVAYLSIELDENVLKNKIFKDLNEKYFSDGNYYISINSRADKSPVFRTGVFENADAEAAIFVLAPQNVAFFVNQNLMSSLGNGDTGNTKVRSHIILNQQFATKNLPPLNQSGNQKMQITVSDNEKPRIFQSNDLQPDGIWTLHVQHTSGSLENSAAGILHKNLAVSFGILFLLGAAAGLIFISAQRAKLFAQRQVDFVSSVSHEFRTPLAVIYSAGENLADGVAKEQAQVLRYGKLIKNEGRKLSAMVEQILDFAGANSGKKKYDRRPNDVRGMIEQAIEECSPLLEDFKVETEIAENLPSILVDKSAFLQSLQNLIANSVKYSDREKYLKISARNGGGQIKISFEDKGIGIAAHDLKHIFEPFYRSKAVVDEQIHGSGLGLSLVKKTIEAHKGKIFVESEPGKGSKFFIQLSVSNNQ